MRFQDDVRWSDQELELQADETSRNFLKFFTEWFDAAERRLDTKFDFMACSDPIRQAAIASAVRDGLADTEIKLGFLSIEWIGQMVVLAWQHWIHGVDMERGLTIIERRALEQMAAVKLAELQSSATL